MFGRVLSDQQQNTNQRVVTLIFALVSSYREFLIAWLQVDISFLYQRTAPEVTFIELGEFSFRVIFVLRITGRKCERNEEKSWLCTQLLSLTWN